MISTVMNFGSRVLLMLLLLNVTGISGATTKPVHVPTTTTNSSMQDTRSLKALLKKLTMKYKEMKSFSACGEAIEKKEEDVSRKSTTNGVDGQYIITDDYVVDFTIKLGKPNYYLVEWKQKVGEKDYCNDYIYSAGAGNYVIINGKKRQSSEIGYGFMAYTGSSSGVDGSMASFFWDTDTNILRAFDDNLRIHRDANIEGDLCYVISTKVPGQDVTLWISKKDILIRQIRHTWNGDVSRIKVTDEGIIKALKNNGQEPSVEAIQRMKREFTEGIKSLSKRRGSQTEIYRNISTNFPVVPEEFVPEPVSKQNKPSP